jgi:hypothetical protein
MKQCVDKQKEHELRGGKAVLRRLPLGDERADDDLAMLISGLIREDVRDIVLAAKRDVERLRALLSSEHERHVPARQQVCRGLPEGDLRHGLPGEVADVERCHI